VKALAGPFGVRPVLATTILAEIGTVGRSV